MELFTLLLPELTLTAAACVLFLTGVVRGDAGRKASPWIALIGLVAAGVFAFFAEPREAADFTGAVVAGPMAAYVKVLTAIVGVMLLLLCWPTDARATGNAALHFGLDAGEFFGLLLLSLAGIMLTAGANDTILLFMALELASIPTYILVSMGRPLPSAQEAGLKYFYLGAMSAAVMLLGFAYLYGATGTTNLTETAAAFRDDATLAAAGSGTWQTLAVVLVVLGFCFKLAAFPLHFYAGDVYTGAATPVTALLSFVPKATGILATTKILLAIGGGPVGGALTFGGEIWKVLLVVSVFTMTVGNAMALLTENVKRVMAYSSIAHSGYMLAALTVLAAAGPLAGADGTAAAAAAVGGVLFYLTAYGVMNAGVFGVLMMLPTRQTIPDENGDPRRPPATTAETYRDLRGAARRHPVLTAAMAICCISLIGIPLTVGFLGKYYVLRPAALLLGSDAPGVTTAMWTLIGFFMLNAAVAAAYYLRIIAEMVLSPSVEEEEALADKTAYEPAPAPRQPWPLVAATAISAVGVILLGGVVPSALNFLGDAGDRASAALVTTTGPRGIDAAGMRALPVVPRAGRTVELVR